MSDRRWWSLPKVFAFSLWHHTLDGGSNPNEAADKVAADHRCYSSDDDEDIEEFLEKQRNVRLGCHELSPATVAAATAASTDSSASNRKLVQPTERTEDKRFARSLSRRRRSRSLSHSSSGSTKYSSFSKASDAENEKVIKETIYEVTSAAGQISFSFFDDNEEGCEDAGTRPNQNIERLYGNVIDPTTDDAREEDRESNTVAQPNNPEAYATETDQPKERHITKLTILLSPARNMEPVLTEKADESKRYQNAQDVDELPLYSVIEKNHLGEKLTQDVVDDLNYVELSEYRRSSSVNTEITTTANMEYCSQSAKMKTRLRKISLRRKRKSQPALKKVNIRLSNAWKSIRGWWEDEKIVLKNLRLRGHVGDVDNEQPDSVSSSEKSFYESIRHLNMIEESQSPELLIDEDGYCSLDLKSESIAPSDELAEVKRTRRRSCISDLSTLRRRLPFPPPRKSNANTFRTSRYFAPQGQDGFEELRRYIKQGGDFCKELSVILQERSEAEIQYAKTLSKLSGKLIKASKEAVGSVGQAWHKAGIELEATSEVHKTFATALCEDVVKPLKLLFESQHRIRKSVENAVDKTGKSLGEWRAAESKSKKQSFVSARENEKLQDVTLDVRLGGGLTGSNKMTASSLHLHQKQTNEKESSKLETKRKKAEELVKKSDVEYYTYCVRAERARLEWETAVVRGSKCFQALEEERLQQLKHLIFVYWQHCRDIGPKLTQSAVRLKEPIESCDVDNDIKTIANTKGIEQPVSEQLLPDFYAEHTALAMNRERRRQALVKVLQLVVQDLERERRAKNGVENLARAFKQSPNFGNDDSQQNVSEKLHHMRFMLTYLEAARYKISCALSEIDGKPKPSHPLASHIHVIRDRQGFQQSILKVPPWVQKETNIEPAEQIESPNWTDRGTADGNSVQPDSDFDEFSSQSSSEKDFEKNVYSVLPDSAISTPTPSAGSKCRALYHYTANLYDELNLEPGDVINIHDKQPDGWWLGELNGVVGIFPATYVEEIG